MKWMVDSAAVLCIGSDSDLIELIEFNMWGKKGESERIFTILTVNRTTHGFKHKNSRLNEYQGILGWLLNDTTSNFTWYRAIILGLVP